MTMKICSRRNCAHASRPQPVGSFRADKSRKDGLRRVGDNSSAVEKLLNYLRRAES